MSDQTTEREAQGQDPVLVELIERTWTCGCDDGAEFTATMHDAILASDWLARHDAEVAARARSLLIDLLLEDSDDIEGTHFKEPADFWVHTRGQVCVWLEEHRAARIESGADA